MRRLPFCIRWQHDPWNASTVRSKPKQSVTVTEVGARQTVPFVLRHLAGVDEQFDVTRDVPPNRKIRLKVFDGHLSTVHLHGEEVDVVMLGMKRFFGVPLIESAVVNAAQHQTFRQGS